MRRVIEVVWGLVILLVSTTVLGWIAYSYTFGEVPRKYPGWWTVILIVLWGFGIYIGIKRIRGSRRETAG